MQINDHLLCIYNKEVFDAMTGLFLSVIRFLS